MPRTARLVIPGLPHHVVLRARRGKAMFFDDQDRRRYLDLLAGYAARRRLRAEGQERTPKVGNHENMGSVPTFPTFPAPAPLARRPASQGKEGTTEIGTVPYFLFPFLRAAFPLRERRGS